MYLCLYPNHLLLSDARVEINGDLSGWVVNGSWFYKEHNGLAHCLASESHDLSQAVNILSIGKDRKVVIVPEMGDYNELLEKYKDAPDDSANVSDALDRAFIEKLNSKPRSGFYDFDDDIAF